MWGITVLNELGVLIKSKVQSTDNHTEYPRGGGVYTVKNRNIPIAWW